LTRGFGDPRVVQIPYNVAACNNFALCRRTAAGGCLQLDAAVCYGSGINCVTLLAKGSGLSKAEVSNGHDLLTATEGNRVGRGQ